MTTVRLLPHVEKLALENPWGLTYPPLYHQLRTYRALWEHDLVVNTYNTGKRATDDQKNADGDVPIRAFPLIRGYNPWRYTQPARAGMAEPARTPDRLLDQRTN